MDVSKELYENINKSYLAGIRRDKNLAALAKKAQEGNATYKDVYDTAESLGQALATAFQKNLSSAVLPDGKMYYNIAKSVVEPFLQDNQQKVIDYAIEVQNALNDAAGIGIRGVNIGIDQGTIDGIINRLSSEDNYDEVSWILDDPVVTNAMKTVDRCVDANVDFAGASGLSPRVTRVTVGRCCDWCEEVAGVYEYPDVPKDVYRRHENCRCIVEYSPGNGKKQNVWTKEVRQPIEIYDVDLPDVTIGRSIGAKALNYNVLDLKTGKEYNFVEGTRITNVKVFAGKGSNTEYRQAYKFAERYGGSESDWQHVKGIGHIDFDGEDVLAEVHWSQCDNIGKVEFFIKKWLE